MPANSQSRRRRYRIHCGMMKLSRKAPNTVARMAHRLTTRAGRAEYGLRKQTVEPVFGIIKHVMGFRQLLLRGLEKVRGEWSLVTLAWNVRRLQEQH